MELVGFLGWWYAAGWRQLVARRVDGLAATADYFSIGLLASTLFSPFRQISAGNVRGPLPLQVRAFFDKLISRVIGAIARLILIVIGIIAMILQGFFAGVSILMWAVVPLLPVIGAIAAFIGWVPRWI